MGSSFGKTGLYLFLAEVRGILVQSEDGNVGSEDDQDKESTHSETTEVVSKAESVINSEASSASDHSDLISESTCPSVVQKLPSGAKWHKDGTTSEWSSVGGSVVLSDSSVKFGESLSHLGDKESASENPSQVADTFEGNTITFKNREQSDNGQGVCGPRYGNKYCVEYRKGGNLELEWFHKKDIIASRSVTELLLACKIGDRNVVKKILETNDVDVNQTGARGKAVTSRLLNDEYFTNGFTALFVACEYGNLSVVQELLKCPDIDVNKVNKKVYGTSPLQAASKKGYGEIVQCLLAHPHIDVDFQCIHMRDTALAFACEEGHINVVKQLLAHPQIDVNKILYGGKTALQEVAFRGHSDVAQMILDHPSYKPTQRNIKRTLEEACRWGHVRIVQMILDHPTYKPDHTSIKWALTIASFGGHSDIIEMIKKHSSYKANRKCNIQ